MIPFLCIKFTLAAVENGYRVDKNKVILIDQKKICVARSRVMAVKMERTRQA